MAFHRPWSVRDHARAERSEFADLAAVLTPEQWAAPSRCPGWSVRDVVAHTVIYLGQSRSGLTLNMIRSHWNVDRLNADGLREHPDLTAGGLVALLRSDAEPTGAAALYGCRVALIECLVHQQDVRRALALTRTIPEDRLRAALNFARHSPVIGGARRTHGVRLVATDTEWSAGHGRAVFGTGEALLLTMTGRADSVAGELTGDGVALLR